VHVHTSSCCAVPLLAQCRVCEYAGCIWIVAVVIVVPIVTAIADSSNVEKTIIFFISNYKVVRYSSSTFYRSFTLYLRHRGYAVK
jgi:hypothetical protein